MSLDQLPPPKGPPAPPEPVPFPEQEGPRAIPASDTAPSGDAGFVPVFARTVDGNPLTEQQARNLYDFLNSRMANGEHSQQAAPAEADKPSTTSYEYVPSANEHHELGSIVRLESDKVRERISTLAMASRSGMFTFAEFVVEMLVEFQQKYFKENQRIISLTEAWVMLVGVVNMVLPDE